MPVAAGLLSTVLLSLFGNCEAEIVFAGDAMQHQAQIDAARSSDLTYDYSACFAQIDSIISAADYAVVNLETPLGGRPYRGYPCFSAPDSYAVALRDAGFDMMLTANNHTLDARDRGLRRTITVLDSLEVDHIGTYNDPTERTTTLPKVVDINGFKVGFLNYTYGTNGIEPQTDVVVDYINRKTISTDIDATRRAGAEIICVAVHWGQEYKLLPNAEQRSLAKFLADKGVDIIFGGHPHVIQPMELQPNPSTGRNTALIYSLGNFISNMKTRDTRGGAISKVTLRRDSVGKAYVDELSYRLIFTSPDSPRGTNYIVYPAERLPQGHYSGHRDRFVEAATDIFDRHNVNITPWPIN